METNRQNLCHKLHKKITKSNYKKASYLYTFILWNLSSSETNMLRPPGHKTYIRRSEDVQDVWWTSYVCSIYVLSRKDNISSNVDCKSSYSNESMHCKYVSIYQHACIYQHFHCSVVCFVLHANVFFCFSLEIWDGIFCENSFH